MIRSKKIVSEIFPKLATALPKSITDEYLKQANDGMLLYAPNPSSIGGKVGNYYCLKCGTHGEIEGENIMCLNCSNMGVRPLRHGDNYNGSHICRLVTVVEPYLVLQDFKWFIDENIEVGITVRVTEVNRMFLAENDYAFYENDAAQRYYRNETPNWKQKKRIYHTGKKYEVVYADKCAKDHAITKMLGKNIEADIYDLCDVLDAHFAVATDVAIEMPKANFTTPDYSLIKEPGTWEVSEQKWSIPGMNGFVKRVTWCANCGKYHEVIEEDGRNYHSSKTCIACGYQITVESKRTFILLDAAETDNGGALLRIHCVDKTRVFAETLIMGIDPVVEVRHTPIYSEYVYVSPEGAITLFNDAGDVIDSLRTPKSLGRMDLRVFSSDTTKELLKTNKAMKRTGFSELQGCCATPKYFEYLKSMPCLEIFSKMGMTALVGDILRKDLSDIPQYLKKNGKESRLSKLSKTQINSLRQSQVLLKPLLAYLRVINRDPDALYEDFSVLSNLSHERHILDIMCVGVPGMTVARIRDYIERVDDAQCCPPSESMQLWSDYLRMLKNLEADLTDSKLVFPNSLKREHDKATRKVEQVNNENLRLDFEKQAENNEWLAYRGKTLSVIIPHQITELYEEGRKLNHCVGSYAKMVSEGKSIIAFVRKNNAIDQPYCTVEIRDKLVVQARGISNRTGLSFPGVKGFLSEWSEQKGLSVNVA